MTSSYIGPTDFQLLLTLFLFVLSWSLDRTAPGRPFLRWWAWAWLAFAAAIVIFRFTVPFATPGDGKRLWEYVALTPGMLEAAFFAVGARAMRLGRDPDRRWVLWMTGGALAVALFFDAAAPAMGDSMELSVAYRAAPRGLALGLVFPYCGYLLTRVWARSPSWPTVLTGVAFFLYGMNQLAYALAGANEFVAARFGWATIGPDIGGWYLSPEAFAWDVSWQAAIGIGYFVLLTREQRRLQATLEVSEERFRTAFASAPVGMALVTVDGTLLQVNQSLAEILGQWPAELERRTVFELLRFDENPVTSRELRAVIEGEWTTIETQAIARTHDGEDRIVVVRVSGVPSPDEGSGYAIAQFMDITDRVTMERELRQAQKREALDRVTGGVAHDFNNLLTTILGNTRFVLAELDPDSEYWVPLDQVADAATDAAVLVRKMLAYRGQIPYAFETLRLDRFVESSREQLREEIAPSVALQIDHLDADLPPIVADPERIEEALGILVANAGEALPDDGGTIQIRTGTTRTRPDGAAVNHLPAGSTALVYVEVRDDGESIPEENLEKIFEPFFTTRFAGRGLGLAALVGIVRNHWGAVSVASEESSGTAVTLYFATADVLATAGGPTPGGRGGVQSSADPA